MEITWLGHACVRIRAKEATVVADPCDKSTGYSLGRPTADLVTVSFDAGAHNAADAVAGNPRVISGPGEFELAGTSVAGITTWHDREQKAAGPRNIVYVFDLEDLRVCHLGALGAVPTSDQLEQIGAVDILFVPCGGGDALEAPPAAETVSLLEPKLVIPIHFATDSERMKLDPLERFLKEMGAKASETHAKLAVTRSSLPEETQVLVLDYKR
ncbi:MAG TPA: MBL fold metallo-hydrolase [Dehalococcoidia bacterium]|nr:MBL fold metallo-hydrolase [Dehalococcoidia bacterium]